MKSYLNLDLLYNTYDYLYPLFYYKSSTNNTRFEIYSPMTKKSVTLYQGSCYFQTDFITRKAKSIEESMLFSYNKGFNFKETCVIFDNFKYMRTKPIKIKEKILKFLKSNTRIN